MMKAMGGDSSKPSALFSRGIADYVFSVPYADDPYPLLGIRTRMDEDRMVVTDVSEDSVAEKNGIIKNDIILALDGVDIKSLLEFRTRFSAKRWDDQLELTIRRTFKLEKEQKTDK